MTVRVRSHRVLSRLLMAGLLLHSSNLFASAFQLWEQDVASMGNFHAGYAAAAEDASTAFYNPAGLTRFTKQQLVVSGISVLSDFKYKGTIAVNTLIDPSPQGVTAQGGGIALIPGLNYVAPLSDKVAFGFSTVVPFGLKTDYGDNTILRYAATESSIMTIDISPTLAIKVSDKTSIGFGPDIQVANAEFDSVGVVLLSNLYGDGINKADDTAYGYHGGLLYEFTPDTRVGLSYHSKVKHHLTGTSSFSGPLLVQLGFQPVNSSRSLVDVTLPAYTALSLYHKQDKLELMASALYTQWNVIRELILQNVAGLDNGNPSTDIIVTIPQFFDNTWNLSAGANYQVTDTVKLRAGVGYDQSPVSDTYRNVQMPDDNRFALSIGSHFQATKTLGIDVAWLHLFVKSALISPPPQQAGNEIVTTNGKVEGGADVLGAQITWDMT